MTKKKILIADLFAKELIRHSQKLDAFTVETASKGSDCLKKLQAFQPDLLIVDLMLPETHGIEILKTAKNSHFAGNIGVILTSYHPMAQNYHSALKLGADYVLEKPFSQDALLKLIRLFFQGNLVSIPLANKKNFQAKFSSPPSIIPSAPSYLKLWGTRGSNPVSGAEHVRFGGNTCCLEIRHGEDLVIIDAGSGIRGLGQILHDHPQQHLNLLLSHTHWDHLLGFPFFYPIYQPEREVSIWSPIGFEKTTKELFSDMLAYAYFPVGLEDIQSKILFRDLRDSKRHHFGSIHITSHYAFHPGPTLCFVIEIGNKKIGYVTDNEFLLGCHLPIRQAEKKDSLFTPYLPLIHALKECDLLIHEAQYTSEEYLHRVGWGHSSISNATLLIKKTGVKRWIVTHHDPKHTDELLLQKQQLHLSYLSKIDYDHKCSIELGYDGMMIHLDEGAR